MRVAIVVPVLNETANMAELIGHLPQAGLDDACEVVVVDGGSSDGTPEVARQLLSALSVDESVPLALGANAPAAPTRWQVLSGPRGRARQMNAGAGQTNTDALLFLHADTRLPPDAIAQLRWALQQGAVWGRFDVQIQGQAQMLRVVAAMMNLRSRISGIATGDQAMFMTRQAYEQVGGLPDQPLMEDIAMSERLKRMGPPACLRARVRTSGRRWEQGGVWRTIFLMWRLRLAYWLGAKPETLARAYR
jgi:rSAM/selenodomain-associated transferase 2